VSVAEFSGGLSVVRPAGGRVWFALGAALLINAIAGNYYVLPGYRSFLEHGHQSAGGTGVDIALIWGAAKTILWMLSFHLGAFCLAFGALAAKGEAARGFRRWFAFAAIAWIALWAIPTLPGPYTVFFAGTGIAIAAMIVAVFAGALRSRNVGGGAWAIAAVFFFALATWDICGLGSVGGMLHPDGAVRAASQGLIVAQTTKLMVELALAWALLAIATFAGRASGEA
jgi:hypothetical protein